MHKLPVITEAKVREWLNSAEGQKALKEIFIKVEDDAKKLDEDRSIMWDYLYSTPRVRSYQ